MVEKPNPPTPGEPAAEEIGCVVAYFAHPHAAIVEIKKGSLNVGDTLWFRGHTTDLKETVRSMQIEHQAITSAQVGTQVGVQVSDRVRRHDRVYKIV